MNRRSGGGKERNSTQGSSRAEEFGVDFQSLAHYECGAVLLALLAHPDPKEDQMRGRVVRTLCHLYLRGRKETDEAWAATPQAIKPIYAFVDPKDIQKDLRTFQRRLRDRMIAARMAMAYIKQHVEGKKFRLPRGLKSVSLNQLAELVVNDLSGKDEANIETRIWRPSRPVIHLAAATAMAIDHAERQGAGTIHLGHVLHEVEVTRYILRTAIEIADLIRSDARFPADADRLMRVVPLG